MDGLREPLLYPSFPVNTWKQALSGYFDADEINNGFEFGWDVSFTEQPRPKDAKWNVQGASIYEKDVQHYIDAELQFGSIQAVRATIQGVLQSRHLQNCCGLYAIGSQY